MDGPGMGKKKKKKNIDIPKVDRPSIETQVHNVVGYNKGKTSNLSKSTKWTDPTRVKMDRSHEWSKSHFIELDTTKIKNFYKSKR